MTEHRDHSEGRWSPFIIAVAPNGARRTKSDHPRLPMTPDEIAATAAACRDQGAAMIHLHIRDANGDHALDADAYRTATAAIRREVGDGLVVQITTEAVGRFAPAQQMAVVRDVRPEAASIAIRELVADADAEGTAAEFFAWLVSEAVMPQFILYSSDDVMRFLDLRRRGIIPGARHFVLFVLGRYSREQQSNPADLLPFLAAWPGEGDWAVCAFGARENACALTAATLGGHSRVGFENNLYMADGSFAPDNSALVAQDRQGAELIGRPIADAKFIRESFTVAA
ncbi:MAG: 3-keto-5-aminohexanoate cleavage protein [Alphaproteobacteria bacterium]|nr:3-keto-5-aminohexanoate cleavage protein [Alphaproteobacteria bacterium]